MDDILPIIHAAKRDAPDAFEELLYRFYPRLRALASKYFGHGADRDDFMQEAYVGFAKAVRDYQDGKSSFIAFAVLCVQRQLITFLKTLNRKKHTHFNQARSLDVALSERQGDLGYTLQDRLGVPPSFTWLDVEAQRDFFGMLRERCTDMERNVLNGYCKGYTYDQIALLYGTNNKSVDNALLRVKKKARKIFADKPYLAESFEDMSQ